MALSQHTGDLPDRQVRRDTHEHCLSVLHVHRPYRRRHPRFEMGWRSENKDHVTDRDMRKDVLRSRAGEGSKKTVCRKKGKKLI